MVERTLRIKTITSNGDVVSFHDIELCEYTYSTTRMGMPELTATLMWADCLDKEWTGNEYVEFRGEKFYIRHTPSSSKSNTDVRYKHEISFVSERQEILGNVYFYDAVYENALTKDKPCSNSPIVTFYGNVVELADRINCALKFRNIGDSILENKTNLTTEDKPVGDGFCVMIDPYGDYDMETVYEFTFDDNTIWGVLSDSYQIHEVPFEVRGFRIILGANPKLVNHDFQYGHENELLTINKKNANAKVINRITMIGSSENIPCYYPNETEYGHIELTIGDENKMLRKSNIEIVNLSQFLGKILPDTPAYISKYKDLPDLETPNVKVIGYKTSFGDETILQDYKLGYTVTHAPTSDKKESVEWNFEIRFTVNVDGRYRLRKLVGMIWEQNQPIIRENNLLMSDFKTLLLISDNGKHFGGQVNIDSYGVDFGLLKQGTYSYRMSFKIGNYNVGAGYGITTKCRVNSAVITDSSVGLIKSGYYIATNGKEYSVGAVGIKISPLVDAMIGDVFGYTCHDKINEQDSLMPPIYRESKGAERFYEALNDTYINPETGEYYVFPNPYIDGKPNEYIYRNEDIKPTIAGVENEEGKLFGEIVAVAYDADDNDLLKSTASAEDDKNNSLEYEHSFFYIKLNIFNGPYGFDLFKSASQTDAMTLQITDGPCAGCKFKVQAAEFTDETGLNTYKNPIIVNDGVATGVMSESGLTEDKLDPTQQNTQTHSIWICVQKDAETFGVIMPNQTNKYLPQIGNKFNIINIDLPEGYILDAERRLEEDGIRYMSENNEEKFTFSISASRIFFAENPDVLNALDEYSSVNIIYDGNIYKQYVSSFKINQKANEALPDIQVELVDEISVGSSFVQAVSEQAVSMISSTISGSGNVGLNGVNTTLNDKRYMKKTAADRTPYRLSSDVGFEVGEFVSGASGGMFYRDTETGQTYIETDKLRVRMKAIFEELEIAKVSTIGGKFIITPGGGINISLVERILDDGGFVTGYRCYFKAKDEDKGAECRFVVGDQVQCHEFNIQNGSSQSASNRYYWRLVTAVNNSEGYIELSATDCDNAYEIPSDTPIAGDTLVQLGNRDNHERQSAIILSTVDAFAPCVTLYNGIDHYTLEDKAVVEYGVDKTKNPPEPFFNCYGRFFFGPRNGNSYLKFEPSVGKLVFSGELINISTLNGKDLDEYIKDVVPPVNQEDIEGYVNAIVDPQIENIQNQIDGVIETWFYNGVPTLSNYPASEWTTANLKIQHLGDLYYDNNTGTAYRFSQNAQNGYYWNIITDDAITKALQAAKDAQDTADRKRRVFVSQPTPPYQKGDLWVNATYPSNTTQATRDPNSNKYYLDILRCKTDKTTGSFTISDWTLASNYTDDTTANKALEKIAGYEYIKEALKGNTIVNGGLVLSSLIKLGTWTGDGDKATLSKVYAGMNGIRKTDKSIASWWGGDMVDKFYNDKGIKYDTPLLSDYAAALVRMDGSAYFSKGNIGFEADGSGWLGNYSNGIKFDSTGKMTFGSGIFIDVNGEQELRASLESIINFQMGLERMLVPCNANGGEISWQESQQSDEKGGYKGKSLKARVGFWSESFVSARGQNTSGGSSSGGGLIKSVYGYSDLGGTFDNDVLTDTFNAYTINKIYTEKLSKTVADTIYQPKGNYLTSQSLSNYVTLDGAQSITGIKTFPNGIKLRTDTSWSSYDRAIPFSVINDPTIISLCNNDADKGLTYNPYTGALKAGSFVKRNGTSSQFLKADGSVDSTTYLASSTYTAADILSKLLTVDGDGSGLNADLLDGVHQSGFVRFDNSILTSSALMYKSFGYAYATRDDVWWTNGPAFAFGANTSYHNLIQAENGVTSTLKIKACYNGVYGGWREFAFTDSNVASATKLESSRTLWGQSFNGMSNVSGDMAGVGSVTATDSYEITKNVSGSPHFSINNGKYKLGLLIGSSGTNRGVYDYTVDNWIMYRAANTDVLFPDGNVGIGTSTPTQKLTVSGIIFGTTGIYSNGYVSARGQNTSSDMALKTIIRPFRMSVEKIAKAPSVEFLWNEDGKKDVGSIAQYFQKINPLLTPKSPDGWLTLQYGKTALLASISIANEVILLKKKIKELEKKVKSLSERR